MGFELLPRLGFFLGHPGLFEQRGLLLAGAIAEFRSELTTDVLMGQIVNSRLQELQAEHLLNGVGDFSGVLFHGQVVNAFAVQVVAGADLNRLEALDKEIRKKTFMLLKKKTER